MDLRPTPAAYEGAAGGIQGTLTDSARGRKDQMEKGGQQLPQRRSSSSWQAMQYLAKGSASSRFSRIGSPHRSHWP